MFETYIDVPEGLPDPLPCPFCGATPKLQKDVRYPKPKREAIDAYEVICRTIGCPIYGADNTYYYTAENAIAHWNRRE